MNVISINTNYNVDETINQDNIHIVKQELDILVRSIAKSALLKADTIIILVSNKEFHTALLQKANHALDFINALSER